VGVGVAVSAGVGRRVGGGGGWGRQVAGMDGRPEVDGNAHPGAGGWSATGSTKQ
jgi:hypothetical protein